MIGPSDEDPGYAARCRQLVARLGRTSNIRFVGPHAARRRSTATWIVVVLTSFSEGQPLVILEAYAWGVPVVATDVGACREMIEGRGEEDRRIGPSGFVTRVAAPQGDRRRAGHDWRATSSCAGAWAPPGTSASPLTISAGTCWRATGRCTRR